MTARQLVYWYNSYPKAQPINLDGKQRVAIIGNGNVAVDVARILLRSPADLASTDISEIALSELRKETVRSVQCWLT
jgi:glutamate dehydrogenase/leucine dehydrogenase